MGQAVQTLIGNRTKLGVDELIKAIDKLGPERMTAKGPGECRSAIDQAAECALILRYTIETLHDKGYKGTFDMETYGKEKTALMTDWEALKVQLVENANRLAEAALTVPDEDLATKIDVPWGNLSYEDIMIYSYWNMSYHKGQVTYIDMMTTAA